MSIIFCLVLSLLLPNASGNPYDSLCKLRVPEDVRQQPEAHGNPLMIFIDVMVTGVRDIPDQGGSYGTDVRFVKTIDILIKAHIKA